MRRLVCWAVVLWTAQAQAMASPFPGGILDPNGRMAFVASEVGITAIELNRGETIWKSDQAHLPMVVAGDRVYAARLYSTNKLSVIAFERLGKGKVVFETEITDFPDWVATRSTRTKSFRCQWRQQQRLLFLDWEASDRSEETVRRQQGQVVVNLDKGVVVPMTVAVQAPRSLEPLPRPFAREAIRWQGRIGSQLYVVVAEQLTGSRPGERRQRLVLRTWDTRSRQEGPSRELLQGAQLVTLPDLENTLLWIRDAGLSAETGGRRPWLVVSVLDGHMVARVPFVPGVQQGLWRGNRAYCLSHAPVQATGEAGAFRRISVLQAVDLEAGKILWRKELGTPIAP